MAGTQRSLFEIEARNLTQTTDLLRAINPKLMREMDKDIRTAVDRVRDRARSLAPSRTGALRAGIRTQKGRKAGAVVWRVKSMTRQGSILEWAEQAHSLQGASLVATLDEKYGAPGRFVFEAWDQTKAKAIADVTTAVRRGEAVVNAELEAMK